MEKKKKHPGPGAVRGGIAVTGEKNLNRLITYLLTTILAVTTLAAGILLAPRTPAYAADSSDAPAEDGRMRGIWLCYKEYASLGLSVFDDEEAYRENADRFLEEALKYRINTVFLHARAFDDAFWRSKTFRASRYIGGDETLTAWEAYEEYDPFGVFLEEAHKYGMEVHAWLNPYRVSFDYYYDPADEESTQRILTAVKELLEFESNGERIDGIHLDDYFYNSREGYYRIMAPYDKYAIIGPEEEEPAGRNYHVVTAAEKRENVNRMIREVYRTVSEAGSTFGISPAGNYDNAMNDGADIDTWLSEEGYIDYIMPQIYWTNQWGEDGSTAMFSDRLDLFMGKRKNKAKFYVGLALYKTQPSKSAGDPGWTLNNTNLQQQIAELESKGLDGYVYFSAQYLFRNCAREELANIEKP